MSLLRAGFGMRNFLTLASDMQDFLEKLEPADIIAVILIAGVLILNWKGVTTMLSSAVLVVVGYYFAKKSNRSDK